MAKTQWHPAFAELLKLLLRDWYEIDTEVKVSELPRAGDVMLVRRQDTPESPFRHLWKHLCEWNVIEFKGMNDHAEATDLELLIHVGTGLTHKFNEQRRVEKLPPLRGFDVAFWYVAPTIGDAVRQEVQGKSRLSWESEGVWQFVVWGHPVFLVSVRDLAQNVDSLPLLLLRETSGASLAGLFAGNKELIERFARWIVLNRPELWQEVRVMAEGLKIDYEAVAKLPDMDDVVRAMPPERVGRALGAEKVLDALLALMTPEQAARLLQSKLPLASAAPSAPPEDQGKEP